MNPPITRRAQRCLSRRPHFGCDLPFFQERLSSYHIYVLQSSFLMYSNPTHLDKRPFRKLLPDLLPNPVQPILEEWDNSNRTQNSFPPDCGFLKSSARRYHECVHEHLWQIKGDCFHNSQRVPGALPTERYPSQKESFHYSCRLQCKFKSLISCQTLATDYTLFTAWVPEKMQKAAGARGRRPSNTQWEDQWAAPPVSKSQMLVRLVDNVRCPINAIPF